MTQQTSANFAKPRMNNIMQTLHHTIGPRAGWKANFSELLPKDCCSPVHNLNNPKMNPEQHSKLKRVRCAS